jgi:hypothetical protein
VYQSDSDNEEDRKNGDSEEISVEEVHLQVLTDDNILNGYVPDDHYIIADMEEDREYLEDLEWEYTDIGEEEEDIQYPIYNGDGLYLCPNASCYFETTLGACGAAGGLTYKFVKCSVGKY